LCAVADWSALVWFGLQRQGPGVATEGSTVYDGEWIADRREGKGKMTWSNGSYYDGYEETFLFLALKRLS